MEVVPALSDASPFQRRDVAEWSHRDRLTGVLETARVETDRWASNSATARHAYGKVVDSRNRSLPDGSAHQRQRQQLEVFQTKGPGGSLQVIRTQTVTSTNSSWRGTCSATPRTPPQPVITQGFENLQLTLNPIDLSSEKSKVSVGRSGSIGTRRPPSRPRSIIGKTTTTLTAQENSVSSHKSPISRICNRTYPETKRDISNVPANNTSVGESSSSTSSSSNITSNGHTGISRKKSSSIEDLQNGVSELQEEDTEGIKRSSKVRRSLQFPLKKLEARGGVCKLLQELEESSKRNASDSRIARKSFEALENVLKRNNSFTDSSNISNPDEIEGKPEYADGHIESDPSEETNRHSVNSIIIDDFSKKFNSSRSKFILEKRHSLLDSLDKKVHPEFDDTGSPIKESKHAAKRHSFVTVESLKEVRGRLKRLNSPLDGLDTESGMEDLEDNDDGIGTEELTKQTAVSITEIPQLRVKSYVYGIEEISQSSRPPILGTGSLESRASNKTSSTGSRSEEWYNRRKSYGFEPVHGDQANSKSSALTNTCADKSRLISTDSGIYRSSDQVSFPVWSRKHQATDCAEPAETEILQVSHSIPKNPVFKERDFDGDCKLKTNEDNIQTGRTTVINFSSKTDRIQDKYTRMVSDGLPADGEVLKTMPAYLFHKTKGRGCSQPSTVAIPVVQEESSPSVVSRRLFYQQLAHTTSSTAETPWKKQTKVYENQSSGKGDDWWRKHQNLSTAYDVDLEVGTDDWQVSNKYTSNEMKRHSIAVDNSWKSFSNLKKNVHDNFFVESEPLNEGYSCSSQVLDHEGKRHSIAVDKLSYLHDDVPLSDGRAYRTQQLRDDTDNPISRKHKKVEFCKTEVHFAAEPGRFNIVETDEKPPPNNMFRRRRRHSTPATDPTKNNSNLPEVRFGDSVYEKQLLGGTEDIPEPNQVVVGSTLVASLPVRVREETCIGEDFADSIKSNIKDEGEIEEQCSFESSLDPLPRSILKNYRKPKSYMLGENENCNPLVDDQEDSKWGIRLRPVVQEQVAAWKSTTTLSSRDEVMPVEYSGQSELQKLLRSLRPAHPKKTDILFTQSMKREDKAAECSVAERVRKVELVASEAKGYSTRVNFGGGQATVVDNQTVTLAESNQRLFKVSDSPKPVWQRREEAMATRASYPGNVPEAYQLSIADASNFNYLSQGTSLTQIGQRCHIPRLSQSFSELSTPETEHGLQRKNTTTTIIIDLSPPPCYEDNVGIYHSNGLEKATPHEMLQSPFLIMKSLHSSVFNDNEATKLHKNTTTSIRSLQEVETQDAQEHLPVTTAHSHNRIQDDLRSEGIQQSLGNLVISNSLSCAPNGAWDSGSDPDRDSINIMEDFFRDTNSNDTTVVPTCDKTCSTGNKIAGNSCLIYPTDSPNEDTNSTGWSERGSAEEVVMVNHLDEWRALYCDMDSELSDDSERADEEVRSYMSAEGDGVSSEVSGSWSRATGREHLYNLSRKEYSPGDSSFELAGIQQQPQHQRSVATAMLPAYDSERLRAVETLVSTRSGQPKITSISLRYGEDDSILVNQKASVRTADAFKFTSKTSISPQQKYPSHIPDSSIHLLEDKQSKFVQSSFNSHSSASSSSKASFLSDNTASSDQRLGRGAEKNLLQAKEKKTFFDRNYVFKSDARSENRSAESKALVNPESPSTNTVVSGFEINHYTPEVSQAHLPKPLKSFSQPDSTQPHSSTSAHLSSRIVPSYERKSPNNQHLLRSQSPIISSSLIQKSCKLSPSTSFRHSHRVQGSTCPKQEDPSNSNHTSNAPSSKVILNNEHHPCTKDLLGSDSKLHPKESSEKTQHNAHKLDRLSVHEASNFGQTAKTDSLVGSELKKTARSMSRSPSPTKKGTLLSKNSKPKDFIGRVGADFPVNHNKKEPICQTNKLPPSSKSTHAKNTPNPILNEQPPRSPIYQNSGMLIDETSPITKPDVNNYDCGLDLIETDSAILEELTRAADEILQAVNGYTDEESRRASSDDDNRRSKDRRSAVLGTISEVTSHKQSEVKKECYKTSNSSRKTQRLSSKSKLGPTSSTSSVESFTRESRRAVVKPERSSGTTTHSSRTARMVQRANSRELLLQTNASSSEDIASGTECKQQRAPPPRRSRNSSNANRSSMSSSTKSKEKQKDCLESSRTSKERVSISKGSTREATLDTRESRKKIPETKHHPIKEKYIPAASGLTGIRERPSHSRHITSSRTKKTTNHTEKAPSSKRRNEIPMQS